MATKRRATTYQYEPLITPSSWRDDEQRFSIRLTQIIDDLYQKYSSLRQKVKSAVRMARNLLDNSDFTNPVNQRGITTLTPAAHSYTIDRWRMDKGKTFTLNDGSITISGAWFVQFIGTKIDNTKTYTMAACLDDGTIVAETGVPASKTRGTYFGFDYSSAMDRVYVGIIKAGTYKWAALYEGSYTAENLPPYVPKGYAAELAECQRYYYQYPNDTSVYGYTGSGGTQVYMIFELPAVMRLTNPTVSLGDRIHAAFGGAGTLQLTSISSSKIVGKQLQLVMPLPSTQATNTVCAGWTNGVITVSADL